MTFTNHLNNHKHAKAALEAIGQFKPSYAGVFQAVENTLSKLAAAEGTVIDKTPVLSRIKKQVRGAK